MKMRKRGVTKVLSFILSLALLIGVLPTTVLAADIYAKPYFTNPSVGTATPAAESGDPDAVSYQYSDTALHSRPALMLGSVTRVQAK